MTNKDLKEGMVVSFENLGYFFKDWILHKDGIKWFAYPTYEFEEWIMRIAIDDVTNLQPKLRTIDDLEEGDIIVDKDGYKKKCLARIGEVYAVSKTWGSVIPDNEVKTHSFWATIYELKNYGYTLYQPTEEKETDIDKCIKVVEEYFEKLVKPVEYSDIVQDGILQALKNLKK